MNEFTSSGSKGAASEMYACAHLLSQGYHVFRSVSPACPVDGVAYRVSEPPRKKVICGTWPGYCRHKSAGTPVCEPCDLTRVRHGEESRKRRAQAANTGHVSERESQ